MKFIKLHKPGTTKTTLVSPEHVEQHRIYGWEPVEPVEIKAVLKPRKKTVKSEPTVDQEVGNNIEKGA